MQRITAFLLTALLVGACGKPELLIGAWSDRQSAGEITLVFEEDGAFVLTAQMIIAGKGVIRGRWERKGDQLQLRFEEEQGFLTGFLASKAGEPAIFEIVTLDESTLEYRDTRSGRIARYTRVSPDPAS
jgi:hypothetical protein